MNLHNIIIQKIRENGAITVAEYMSLALSHPEYGYYMRKDPFGRKGDFITAPEISQCFGELIGAWCADLWLRSGGGDIQLVEVGGGRGTLMKDALRATASVPAFHDSLCVTMVETSPLLQDIQQDVLADTCSRIYWQNNLDDLPRMPAIFIMNELFDALPIRQYIRTSDGLKEKMVDIDENDADKLSFVIQETGLQLVKGGEYSNDEQVVESCPEAKHILRQICGHLQVYGGAGIIIDYGYVGGNAGNTLQSVREHGFHPVLEMAGKADITAHVDFDALREVLIEENINSFEVVGQGAFLQRLGIELRAASLMQKTDDNGKKEISNAIDRLISPVHMGELFKVLAFTSYDDLVPAGVG